MEAQRKTVGLAKGAAEKRGGPNPPRITLAEIGVDKNLEAERRRREIRVRASLQMKSQRFAGSEPRWLTAQDNLSALADLSGKWIDRVHARRPPRGILLDMDSSVSPTYGEQEMSVWNGHYECTCYHPLFVFNQFGDLERCALRPGNVHSADCWENVLKPVVARYRGKVRIALARDDGLWRSCWVRLHFAPTWVMQVPRIKDGLQGKLPSYRLG
jgi:hypothetical protein